MADEDNIDCEQRGKRVLNPGLDDQCHRGQAEPTAPAPYPATTTSPPSWWQERAGAHDLEQAQKRGQHNLL